MGFFRNIFDGLLSLGAFLLSLVVFGGPAWATYMAVSGRLVTPWVYVALAGMLYVGFNLAVAFLRRALDGISLLRERKRQ